MESELYEPINKGRKRIEVTISLKYCVELLQKCWSKQF